MSTNQSSFKKVLVVAVLAGVLVGASTLVLMQVEKAAAPHAVTINSPGTHTIRVLFADADEAAALGLAAADTFSDGADATIACNNEMEIVSIIGDISGTNDATDLGDDPNVDISVDGLALSTFQDLFIPADDDLVAGTPMIVPDTDLDGAFSIELTLDIPADGADDADESLVLYVMFISISGVNCTLDGAAAIVSGVNVQ